MKAGIKGLDVKGDVSESGMGGTVVGSWRTLLFRARFNDFGYG